MDRKKIAVCDDDQKDLLAFSDHIRRSCREREIDVDLECFFSAQELLDRIAEFDIIFMDIYLRDANGLEMIQQVRRKIPDVPVVFITSSRDFAIDAFRVNALHYLVKPLSRTDLETALERCFAMLQAADLHSRAETALSRTLTVKIIKNPIPAVIRMQDIQYIEVFRKVSVLHTKRSEFETYASLNSIYEQLDDSFLRVQRSFIINMDAIEALTGEYIMLDGGAQIPVSRKNRAAIKQQYQDFLFHKARGARS